MNASTAAHVLARASAALTETSDLPGALAALLRGCNEALQVDAAGILIETNGHLELLAASSHQASELEIHQSQLDEGPCIEAHRNAVAIWEAGRGDILAQWPTFGQRLLAAGFESAHASPLIWHNTTIGAMGLFRQTPEPFTTEDDIFAQAFADVATVLIVSAEEFEADALAAKLDRALTSRVVIEQAKGALAEQHDLSMADAYDLLVQSALDKRVALSQWAEQILQDAHRGPKTRSDSNSS